MMPCAQHISRTSRTARNISAGPEDIQGVIFDCDGVLFDSRAANTAYYDMIRKRLGLPPVTPEEEEYLHSHSVRQSLEHIIPPDKLDLAEAVRREILYKDILPFIRRHDGVCETAGLLKRVRMPCAINTNRMDTMDLLLQHFGLTGFFSPVVTAATVSEAKPHPEGVFRILEQWRMHSGDVVYIGDSAVDQETAQRAGVEFWAYCNPLLRADRHIGSFWDIYRFFRPLESGRQTQA